MRLVADGNGMKIQMDDWAVLIGRDGGGVEVGWLSGSIFGGGAGSRNGRGNKKMFFIFILLFYIFI